MADRTAQREGARAPTSGELQLGVRLAESLARAGRTEDAVQQYLWVADALASRGDTMLAVSTYRLVGHLAPYCTRTQLRCAEAYAAAGHAHDAIAIWDWAAAALMGFGRPLEAAAALRQAVEAAPGDLARRRRLGELYASLGMIDAAVAELAAVARGLFAGARTHAYLELAGRILELRRDHVETLRGLARVHLHRRDTVALVDTLRRLLGVSRRDPVAGELVVETLVAIGRARAARDAAVAVARVLVSSADALDREVARGLVDRARRRHPTDVRLRELHEELSAEPVDPDDVDELTEPEGLCVEDTPVPAAAIDQPRASEDGETNVYSLAAWRRARASEPTRPDVRGCAGLS